MNGRSWKDVRAAAADAGFVNERDVAAARATLDAEVRAFRLAEVRKAQGMTQREVAAAMGVAQPRVSAIEHGLVSATEISTLRAYVEALGGNLRLVADFGDETLTLAG